MAITTLRQALSPMLKPKKPPTQTIVSHLLVSNAPPTDEERQLVQDLIPQLHLEVQSLGMQLEKELWPWKKATLNARLESLKHDIERHVSVLSIIRTIPTEVIQHIFMLSDVSPWTLSHICSTWRQYAHALHSLWATIPEVMIDPDLPEGDPTTIEMLTTRLRYASSAPLHVKLSTIPVPMDDPEIKAISASPALALLLSHSDHWRTAKIELPFPVIASFAPGLKGKISSLETLRLRSEFKDTSSGQSISEIDAFSVAPQLKSCDIEIGYATNVVLNAPDLINLSLGWPTPFGVSALAQFTSLVSLTLSCELPVELAAPPIPATTTPLTLPLLKNLSGDLMMDRQCSLLQSLVLPSVTDISLRLPAQGGLRELMNMLVRSGQRANPTVLRFLLRQGASLQPGELVNLLRLMPNLVGLSVGMPPAHDIHALAKIDAGSAEEVLVPRLRQCTFNFEPVTPFSERVNWQLCVAIKSVARKRCELTTAGDDTLAAPAEGQGASSGLQPLQNFQLTGDPLFYRGLENLFNRGEDPKAYPRYTQGDFESWPVPENSKVQRLTALHNALIEEIPSVYLPRFPRPDKTDDAWKQRVSSILDELEALNTEGLDAFDILTSNLHVVLENLTEKSIRRTLEPGHRTPLSFPQADRLCTSWTSLLSSRLHDIHWVHASDIKSGSKGRDPLSLIYIPSTHPIRGSEKMGTEGIRMRRKMVYFLRPPPTVRSFEFM